MGSHTAFWPNAWQIVSRLLQFRQVQVRSAHHVASPAAQAHSFGAIRTLSWLHDVPRVSRMSLCCSQPQFNFSSASHSLLSVFRALSGTHGQAIAARSKDAVAQQVAILLPMAQAVGPVCVTTMPAEQRDKYIKQVLVVQGLVALTSAVARNVTAMLPQVRVPCYHCAGVASSAIHRRCHMLSRAMW